MAMSARSALTFDQVHQVLNGFELVRFHDGELARALGQPRGDGVLDAPIGGEVEHDRLQIEHDLVALGGDERGLVVDHAEKRLVRLAVGRAPQLLHPRPLEEVVGGLHRVLLQRARTSGASRAACSGR